MANKTIRSHRERVKQAKIIIGTSYKNERISIIDREAFVEFLLLEDIANLYKIRLRKTEAIIPNDRAGERSRGVNIRKFKAIINVFNAAISVAQSAIDSGDYRKVWRSIHEGALMSTANSVNTLPQLKKLAIELLKDLTDDMAEAEEVNIKLEEDIDDLDAHEQNVFTVKGITPTIAQINDVIRDAEEAIPDDIKKNNRPNPNT